MELYWLLRLPHLHGIFEGIGVLLCIAAVLSITIFFMGNAPDPKDRYDEDLRLWRPYKYLFIYLGVASVGFLLISAFIPTKTDLALMMGWDAINSNSVQEVIEILKDKIK